MRLPFSPAPLGRRGENAAARHLVRKGYRILERNLELAGCEIDIIAQKDDTIAFIEVKTRAHTGEIHPEDSVGQTKRQHIRKAARRYLHHHPNDHAYYRYDIISIHMPGKRPTRITHIENAFGPDDP